MTDAEKRAKALADLKELGERAKAQRDRLPQDSPLHSSAFQLASLIGEIEAVLNSPASGLRD